MERAVEWQFDIINLSKIPTRKMKEITDKPLIWRYFVTLLSTKLAESQLDEPEFTAKYAFCVKTRRDGAYVFSCSKNMGVFKARAFPEDVGRFYKMEEYGGYLFMAHEQYPTSTPGWLGGSHPFALLDSAVVHNGENFSYDTNRCATETYGYKYTLQTDTEVITYILDYLHRKKGLAFAEIASVIATPFWQTIEKMFEEERETTNICVPCFSHSLQPGRYQLLWDLETG